MGTTGFRVPEARSGTGTPQRSGYSKMDAGSSYRESAVRVARPVRLVICLYQQAIEHLRQAVIALEKGDIKAHTRGINHALMVIAQLQGWLHMERGGEVARNLARFYSLIRRLSPSS
jgi:flagellar biosynthetic protein FliS